jgi:preprotein translocase subunit SecF
LEFFHDVNIDFLGKKWYFLAFSLIFSVAGVGSMLFWHGIPWGLDFRGGTQVEIKFSHKPNDNAIRSAMDHAGLHDAKIQNFTGQGVQNEVLIDLDVRETTKAALDQGKDKIIGALETTPPAGKQDLNNASLISIKNYLIDKDPLRLGTEADQKYGAIAQQIIDYRNNTAGGVLDSIDQLNSVVNPAVVAALKDGFFLSDFGVRNVAIVGPEVGRQLTRQAGNALLPGRYARLPRFPLRMDLRRGRGHHRIPRYVDYCRSLFSHKYPDHFDGNCGYSDADWLLQ